jgi:Tfp pilus assembly PilM family ATPase/Tfp pilus assembly protein PilN
MPSPAPVSPEKSKNPKPPKAKRNNRYSIDITNKHVRIIRTNSAGAIIRSAAVDIPALPEKIDREYVEILSRAIKKAARAAKVPLSFGLPCEMVTGGPHVIARRFTWPEMPLAAIRANALTEVTPYLPGDPAAFTIGFRVVRRVLKPGSIHPVFDVIVAAISTEISKAYTDAARKAGFAPTQLDIIENARGKLAAACNIEALLPVKETDGSEAEKTSEAASYAVLDITGEQINMTLFLEGVFYSNRYFALFPSAAAPPPDENVPAEIFSANEVITEAPESASQDKEFLNIDIDTLVTEVTSIIDYIQYRERNSSVQCILLLGDDEKLPGLLQSLKDSLDIPIFATADWLLPGICGKGLSISDALPFLDAYGAALPAASSARTGGDLDLRPQKTAGVGKKVVLPLVITALILGAAMTAGILLPRAMLMEMENTIQGLDDELARFTVSQSQIAEVNQEITRMTTMIDELDSLYTAYPQSRAVIPVLYRLENENQILNTVSISGGELSVQGRAPDFAKVADSLVWLRNHPLFENAAVHSVNANDETRTNEILWIPSSEDDGGIQEVRELVIAGYTDFSMTVRLQKGAGER